MRDRGMRDHALHYLLVHDLERGKEKIWAALEVSDYSVTRAARVLDIPKGALHRFIREFALREEYEKRKGVHMERMIDERLAPELGEHDGK